MDNIKLSKFDIVEFLDTKEAIKEYLSQVFEDGNINEIIKALHSVEKAKKIYNIKDEINLYRDLENNIKSKFENIMNSLNSLGLKTSINN